MFYLVVALVESISVSLRTQATFLLLSVGTNVIIMPSRFLYKEHLLLSVGTNVIIMPSRFYTRSIW